MPVAFVRVAIVSTGIVACSHGAINLELSSVLDIKRGGGTSVGSFVDNAGPAFMLSASNQQFNVRNSGGGAPGNWAWRASGVLESDTSVQISDTELWSSGIVTIQDSPLLENPDRFNPTSVGYLIGRWDDAYYAFRFGTWSADRGRLRLYGVETADVTLLPEFAQIPLLAGLAAVGALGFRRRHGRGARTSG